MKTQTAKHTPTARPWHCHIDLERFPFTVQNSNNQQIAQTGQNVYIDPGEHQANAEFICKAVNEHDILVAQRDALLEACKAICVAVSDCLPPSGESEIDVLYYKAKLLAIDNAAAQCSTAIALCEQGKENEV